MHSIYDRAATMRSMCRDCGYADQCEGFINGYGCDEVLDRMDKMDDDKADHDD